ncbi:hypothetical protein BT69DRAFT_1202880, partial [Atractiella rhizophila]
VVLGLVLGLSVWNSFVAGPIQFKSLPRQMFGTLQSRQFPAYFAAQTLSSVYLLAFFYYSSPDLLHLYSPLQDERTFNFYLIAAGMLGTAVTNRLIVGPWTNGIMKERHKLERAEGKSYTDKDVSPEMKALSTRFAKAHGVSSLLNLVFILAALWHTAWAA